MMLTVNEENWLQRWFDTVSVRPWRETSEHVRDTHRDLFQRIKSREYEEKTIDRHQLKKTRKGGPLC